MSKKKKSKRIEDGIEFDSEEEIQFYLWLNELKSAGYIKKFKKVTESIVICEPYVDTVVKKSKDKVKKTVFRSLSYTPDFEIIWNESAMNKFCLHDHCDGKIYVNSAMKSIIDVKGRYSGIYNNSGVTFPIIQKVLFAFKGIFVQKIIPDELFASSFLPEKLFKTKTGKDRSWRFAKITLKECIKDAN